MNRSTCAIVLSLMLHLASAFAEDPQVGVAEAKKCESRIATVERDLLNKYEAALGELQLGLQKAADLEGALSVRAERERIAKEQTLGEKNLVASPKGLRVLQSQTIERIQELSAQLVTETIPKLVELKRQLTIAGKLDEAVAVREALEKLQNTHLPAKPLEPGATVAAEALISAYSADRTRADKIYKGRKMVVRGVVGAFRQDPLDAKNYQVFLTGGTMGGWVQCEFPGGEQRFREEKSYQAVVLTITGKGGESVRIQKGSALEVRGVCDGWDEAVRLVKCELDR